MQDSFLIIDDDEIFIEYFKNALKLKCEEYEIKTTMSPEDGLEWIRKRVFDVVLLDVDFGSKTSSGLDYIKKIHEIDPAIQVLIVSNFDDHKTIHLAMQKGASDFISKSGINLGEVVYRVDQAVARRKKRIQLLNAPPQKTQGAVYRSKIMQEVFFKAKKARITPNLNVLIEGPTGAGKELVARAVHGEREEKPFIAVNCAAITPSLTESELFGHEKGSFTGSVKRQIGKFEAADQGDIFLDEVDCLTPSMQAALLRVLETREIMRVGGTTSHKLSFRVIAATNADLASLVQKGEFREDLMERLDGIRIRVPPLNQRIEDIEALIRHFLTTGGREGVSISSECLTVLKAYSWPKNVRQLKQVITSMVALSEDKLISIIDIPEKIRNDLNKEQQQGKGAKNEEYDKVNQVEVKIPLHYKLQECEHLVFDCFIKSKIAAVNGRMTKSLLAKELGVNRTTLYRILKKLNLENALYN